jgi:hypothetical protein
VRGNRKEEHDIWHFARSLWCPTVASKKLAASKKTEEGKAIS